MKKPRRKKKIAKKKKKPVQYGYGPIPSEEEHMAALDEDLRDAWIKLKEFCLSLGEQRMYNSVKAIMFARKTCYLFVRPKKSYVEVTFFTSRPIDEAFRSTPRTKLKHENVVKLVHADQVEEPMTDWIREAFELSAS